MKKTIAILAVIGIIFSSCNGKYTIAKRKYNKGFYVSKSSTNSTKPGVAQSKPVKINTQEEKIETVVVAKSIEIAPLKTITPPVSNEINSYVKSPSHGPAIASISKNNYSNTKEIKSLKVEHTKTTVKSNLRKGDSNLIVMVILSLFPILCLIAVYMHDSGITLNFWIDLLLHLTLIGEIIFALLVVLDVIDLA